MAPILGGPVIDASSFSPDYTCSRARFRAAALSMGCHLESHPIDAVGPDGKPLTIDFAMYGSPSPRRVLVLSSGTHGVEGYLGAAAQVALLESKLGGWQPQDGVAVLMVHAVNPYGFAWTRRVNEHNVDMNRNFLLKDQPFEGVDEGYVALNDMLNPERPAGAVDPFLLRAAGKIASKGFGTLKNAVAQGQYAFPRGLFYGGDRPQPSQLVLQRVLPALLGTPERVIHLDVHTGMGKWGSYALVVPFEDGTPRVRVLKQLFGPEAVQAMDPSGVLYEMKGNLGAWLQQLFPETQYDTLLTEFGTYNPLAVISALRAENRATHWSEPGSQASARAKRRLKEIFMPAKVAWRRGAVRDVVALFDVARRGLEAVD